MSVRASPARSVRPSASSRSRNGSNPASDVTREPWNSSFRRGSKATRRTALLSSPAAPSMSGPADTTTPLKDNRNSGFQVAASYAHLGNAGLDEDALDLVKADLIVAPVIELGRAGRGVVGDHRRLF